MFTGIVDHQGILESIEETDTGKRFKISTRFQNLVGGESISVDGICLTVTEHASGIFFCDLSPETLNATSAGSYRVGKKLNLERALRMGDSLGGHWVTGHVDQTVRLDTRRQMGEYLHLGFREVLPSLELLLVKKGSVSVNGVSLTINEVSENGFEAMIIPHTQAITNLGELVPGDRVNLELDWMAKLVSNQVRHFYLLQKKSEETHV